MNPYESALNDIIRELESADVGSNHSQGYRMAIEDIKAWRGIYKSLAQGGAA